MSEAAEAAPQLTTDISTGKRVTPVSPLFHFIDQHCKKCPYLNHCEHNMQLLCILARIALDLHVQTRNDLRRNGQLDR